MYTCSIYLDRPEDCRHYPSLIAEMIRDECEMIEVTDLDNTKKAQVTLDILMSDSRPPSNS
jgi:Fe-S-cluster containining protein